MTGEIEEKTNALVLLLRGHSEKKTRAYAFKEKLEGLEIRKVVEILNCLCLKANARDPACLEAYNALPQLIQSLSLRHKEIGQMRKVARDRNYPEIFQILVALPPYKNLGDGAELSPDASLKELILGHRKSLARTQNLFPLKRFLREQDPAVIRSLLRNPRLTESDVLRIASLQPTSPRVLAEIFASLKWIARYRVKKALVYNPYCLPAIALHLLKFRLVGDLREIPRDENLHPVIREATDQLLAAKTKVTP